MYIIFQKLGKNTYEIAAEDVQKTFHASQAMGGYSSSFKNSRNTSEQTNLQTTVTIIRIVRG